MFPPYIGPVAQLVRALACHARGRGFEPHSGRQYNAVVTQLVECHLAKVDVASSNLVYRSIWRYSQAVRHGPAKPPPAVLFRVAPPKNKALLRKCFIFCVCVRRTQHRFATQLQTSFDRRSTSFRLRTQNDVMAKAINDVMLYINDVLPSAKTLLRLCRKYTLRVRCCTSCKYMV